MKEFLSVIAIMLAAVCALSFIGGSAAPDIVSDTAPAFPETVSVYLTGEERIVTVPATEYIEGCLAAEIDLSYRTEALKAQAAASATYALRLMREHKAGGKLPEGADISDDKTICQPYMTAEERQKQFGAEYEKYREKLAMAAEYGISHIITFCGEPIYAVYHAVSAGATCPAEYVWGRSIPYLKRAESRADEQCRNFECINELRSEDIRVALARYDKNAEIPVDPAKWFTELTADENGYVISVNIGRTKYSGGDIWRILGLRSTAFTVSYIDNIFTFTTRGYGHGAGLSQYGANALAVSGVSAGDILRHYYGDDISVG